MFFKYYTDRKEKWDKLSIKNKKCYFSSCDVKAPYKGIILFHNYISVMVSIFYYILYSLLYFSGLSPVSIYDLNTFWIFLHPFLSRLIHLFLLFSIWYVRIECIFRSFCNLSFLNFKYKFSQTSSVLYDKQDVLNSSIL